MSAAVLPRRAHARRRAGAAWRTHDPQSGRRRTARRWRRWRWCLRPSRFRRPEKCSAASQVPRVTYHEPQMKYCRSIIRPKRDLIGVIMVLTSRSVRSVGKNVIIPGWDSTEVSDAVCELRRDRGRLRHIRRLGGKGAHGEGTARPAPGARPQCRAHQGLRQRHEGAVGIPAPRRSNVRDGRGVPGAQAGTCSTRKISPSGSTRRSRPTRR